METQAKPKPPGDVDVTSFSNAMRLTGRQWLGVGLVALLLPLAPEIWKVYEPFDPGPDYRMPHELSNDYWLYQRFADLAADRCDTVLIGDSVNDTILIGDSVIWGEYATPAETLSHYLNEQRGQMGYAIRYANLGLDGAHPLALEGLVRHYAGAVRGKNVVLHCNPLWMSSPRRDLQEDRATEFNHPRLVPQFVPAIPSYPLSRDKVSERIGIVVEQRSNLSSWTGHLQQAYYDRSDIPEWTLSHPYDNPLEPLTRGLPPLDFARRHAPQPWFTSGIGKQDYPWVDLETSLQWQAFQRVVAILQERGNRVFVLVGPFNEHLLEKASLERYQKVKATIRSWLEAQGLPYAVPGALPSEQYGDASHPLAAGYAALARQLLKEPAFR